MNVLITGASSGIGRATAELFSARGHSVFGIDLKPADCCSFRCYTADITDEASVAAVRDALSDAGIRLDLILNFAGIFFFGSLLETDGTALSRIFEVNVLGSLRVCRLFFPLLKEKGRIVVTTSEVAPLDALPFNGIYGATKTALDACAQSLRHEAGLLGVKVITVRPGAVDTPLANGSIPSMRRMVASSAYFSGQAVKFEALMNRFTGKMLAPEALAQRIYTVSLRKHPRDIYTVHPNTWLRLLSALPASVQVQIVRRLIRTKV